MRKNLNNFLGKKINRLLIVEIFAIEYPGASKKAKCICECGKEIITSLMDVVREKSKSCGCLAKEINAIKNFKHGLTNHPLRAIYEDIRGRCYREKDINYHNYGGRGIKMCKEWRSDFKCFYDWAIANGWRKGLETNRKDNDGDYTPENCNFISRKENSRNKRTNRFLTLNGVTKCVSEWAEELNISDMTLRWRINKWDIEKALTTPIDTKFSRNQKK